MDGIDGQMDRRIDGKKLEGRVGGCMEENVALPP